MRIKRIAMLLGWLPMYAVEGEGGGAPAVKPAEGAAGDPAAGAGAAGEGAAGGDDPGAKDPWLGIRERYAGEDAKKLAQISRYQNPEAALDALLGLQNRVRSGELRAQLPKGATPEQVKAWREESGIPETHDKYALPDTLKIEERDKPYVDTLLAAVHAKNGNNDLAATVVEQYYAIQQKMTEERIAADKTYVQGQEDALRATWGNEYRLNMNSIAALTATMPEDVRELFTRGRLADGNPLMGNAKVAMWLTGLSREINPVTSLLPPGGGDPASAIETEIKQIEGWMQAGRGSANGKKYWDSPETQERYRNLLDGQSKVRARA